MFAAKKMSPNENNIRPTFERDGKYRSMLRSLASEDDDEQKKTTPMNAQTN